MLLWVPKPRLFDPYWLWQKRQSQMLVTDLVPKGIVFIGHTGLKGGDDDFIADGTGSIIVMRAYDGAFPYVVTA